MDVSGKFSNVDPRHIADPRARVISLLPAGLTILSGTDGADEIPRSRGEPYDVGWRGDS